MRHPYQYNDRDEVKVAVLVDEMRAEPNDQGKVLELLWGLAAVASAYSLLWIFS